MVEKRRTEAMAIKHHKTMGEIILSNEEEGNYENDTGDETNPNQANNEYQLLN